MQRYEEEVEVNCYLSAQQLVVLISLLCDHTLFNNNNNTAGIAIPAQKSSTD